MRRANLGAIWVGIVLGASALATQAQQCRSEARLVAFAGPAFFTGKVGPRPFVMAMSADVSLLPLRQGNLGLGVMAEGGVIRPALSGTGNYYFSGDAMLARVQPEWVSETMKARPFVAGGYTILFNATGSAASAGASSASSTSGGISVTNAANIGLGLDRQIHDDLWLRLEVREHYTPDGGQHVLVLRVGLVSIGSLR